MTNGPEASRLPARLGSVLSTKMIVWGAALVVLVGVGTVVLLLAFFGSGTETDRGRLEVFRIAGTVVLGVGGGIALLLAARRQRSTELDLLHKHYVADDIRFDAAERRITELYTKAAEALGSDKAPVRLAGLYALERLANDTPNHRQTIVNVLCAYLRMPYDPPDADKLTTEEQRGRAQELEVRRTAQRILADHLRPGATFWPDIDLELSHAVLHLFDLKDCRLRNARLGGARFVGNCWFDGTHFTGYAVFGGATFERSALFRETRFDGVARFRGAHFQGVASFRDARFLGEAIFGATDDGATFELQVSFAGASFDSGIACTEVRAVGSDIHVWPPGWELGPDRDSEGRFVLRRVG